MSPAPILRGWSSVGWGAFAGCSLVVGLAALLGPPQPPGGGTGVRVMLRLPDPLVAAVVALVSLAALLLLAMLIPRELRRKRKGDEEFELYYEPPKVSPWLLLVLWALVLVPVGAAAYLLWLGWTPVEEGVSTLRQPSVSSVVPPPFQPAPDKPIVSLPLFTRAVGFLAVLAGLGSLGLVLWIFFGDRLAWWRARPLADRRAAGTLSEVVEESLDDLRRDPDARRAIIRCYRRFEQVLAAAGFPRAPWETPTEFMREALSRLPLSRDAVKTLTGLFEVARFSRHSLGLTEREVALGSLTEIKAALEWNDSHAST